MEKIKLEVAGIPAVLYGKRSRRVYLYVHGKNGSAAEAARFARIACSAGWQVLAVDLPEHGARKDSPEKLVPWVVTRELQAVYARMQPVWKHIRVYGVSIGAWLAMQALQTQQPEKALLVSPIVDMENLILDLMQQVCQRNAVQIAVNELVQLFPDRERLALFRPGATVHLTVQTGHRGQRPLGQPQNLPHGVVLQLPAEAVAAALAALPLDQSRAREHGDDAL